MKMRPKVLIDNIDRYHRYRLINPLPIVPIYVYDVYLLTKMMIIGSKYLEYISSIRKMHKDDKNWT
jgi:hypothetical protein